jgi:hypothetical protein
VLVVLARDDDRRVERGSVWTKFESTTDFFERVEAEKARAILWLIGGLRCGRVPRKLLDKVLDIGVQFDAGPYSRDDNFGRCGENSIRLSNDRFLEEARGLPGRSRTILTEGLSAGDVRRRQYSSSSEWIISCDSETPISSVEKSSTVAVSPVVEVERSWTSTGRAGTGGTSTVCSGKVYLKSILAGVLKVFSSCSTKLCRSEAPDSFSMRISPVKSKDFLASSSEARSDSPDEQSAWKTCARKMGIGSTREASVGAGGAEVVVEEVWSIAGRLELCVEKSMSH